MINFYSPILRSFSGKDKTQKNELQSTTLVNTVSVNQKRRNPLFTFIRRGGLHSSLSTFNFSLLTLGFAFYAMVGGVWGQAATATWALTSNASVSTSGNIAASNMTLGAGLGTPSYAATGVTCNNFDGGVCTPNSNDYFEFNVTANCGYNVSVTSITFTANNSGGTRCLQLFQSVDGVAETQISCNTTSCSSSNFSTTSVAQNFTTGTISINLPQGKSIRLRLYGANGNTARTNTLKNFVVNATATAVSQLTPAVSISSNDADNTFCSGTNVTVTASASNTGGGTVTYQWKLNGGNVGSNATTYSSTTLANNDQVSCSISISGGSCLASTTANSSSITNTVNSLATADAGPALSAILQGATSAQMGGSVGGSATGGTWSGGAGTWTNASNPSTATYTAGANESGNITLTLTTSGGSCGTTATKTITVSAAPATIPVSINFTSSNPFTFVNGSETNSWAYGSATGNPANSMYISNNSGTSNAYNNGVASVVQAYRDITVPAGATTASFSFNWIANGESTFDYLRVWMVPNSYFPTAGTQITSAASGGIQVGANFNQVSTWQNYTNATLDISSFANSTMRLVFEWRNDGSAGTNPPGAIDNVNLSFPTPTVTSFSPTSSCVGSSITLTGTNFSSITGVSFNGVAASTYTVNSSTEITVTVPAATTGTISVTGLGGTGTSASNFTVSSTPPTPTVSVTGSSTINVGGTSSLTASGTGGTLNWFTVPSGGTSFHAGTSLDLPTQCSSGTTTYYVEEVGGGSCNSPRGSAAITVRPVITSNPSNSLICTSGGSVTLSTQLTGASGITWSPSTNLSTTSGASTVASPTATTQYSVSATVTGCPTINATQNVGVIEGVSFTPTASPTAVCEGATSALASNLSSSGFSATSTTFSMSTAVSPTNLASAGAASVTLASGSLDDGGWSNIPLNFTYNFFGNSYNSVNIGTNGIIQFGTYNGANPGGLGDYTFSSTLPNSSEPMNIVAAAAVDLNATSGTIRYWTQGTAPTRVFVVEWNAIPGFSSNGSNTAQIKLFETTGNVEVHIQNSSSTNTKVVGLQNTNAIPSQFEGTTALSTTSTITNQAWKFIPGANYTFQWATAGSNIGGATATSYTTPALNTPGSVTYTVAATNPNTQCASTANVSVTVNARPAAPVSTGDVTACSNAGSQNLVVTTYTDVTADWYNATTAGTLLTDNNLTHATSTAGTYYAESQNTITGCTSTSRTAVTLNVNTSPNAPTVTTPVTYCQGATASALTATAGVGNTLKWYTAAPNFPSVTGATLTGSAPTPSTSTAASTDYFVSQTAGACESQLAKIVVTINASPATPSSSDPSAYCQNTSATQLTATAAANCTLYWYSDPTTSAGQNTTAPTPITTTAGTFYFYVANRNNTTTCEGSRKTITVTVNPSISASVTNSASSTSACGGGSITFTATPTNGGASPTYVWKLNGATVGSNSATYTLTTPTANDQVYVIMTPSAQTCLSNPGASNSNTITLTSSASTPTVSIQSTASSAICPGTSVTFSVNSSTNMGSTPSYVWKKGGVAISGATNSTYTTTGLVNGDQITLEMTSSLGGGCLTQASATSSAITTTVNAATAISSQPVATAACLGSSANFSVTASGQGTLTYQWKKAGTNITGNGTAITNALTLSGIVAGDAANYSVDVTGSCGTVTSSSVALSINTATSISTQPTAVTQCAGTTANFSVTAAGQGSLSYDWRKDGVSINGATSSTLAVSNISSSNAGNYSVIVTGGCGNVTSSNALLAVNAASAIATHPSASTVCAGNTANFSVTATGTGSLTYQWKRDGTNVGTSSSSLSVSNAQSANAGTYTVEVSGTCGTATSNGALLTVNPITSITTQPTASAGCEGQNTTFTVVATGTAPLSYQWKFGGNNIGGATAATYNIPSTTNANDGSYFVNITGGCGTVNSSAVNLTVYPTPTANAGVDQTVCPGEMITLSGSGVTSGTYTWNNSVQNGVAFAAPATTTTYTVTGTSPQGCPDTDEVLITIKDKPTISIGGTTTICIANSTTLTASGTIGNTYSWSTGGNTASVAVNPSSTTSYTVTATGTNGCTNTGSQSVTVNTPSIPYSIAGKEYYIWRGTTSANYQTATNWYYKGTNDVWNVASTVPSAGTDVIVPSGTCVTNSPEITSSSSTADSVVILSGATLNVSGSNVRFTVENDVNVRSGASLTLASGGTLEVRGGSLKFLSGSTFTPNNGTVEMHYRTGHTDAHVIECSDGNNNTFYNLSFHGDQIQAGDTAVALNSNITVTNELNMATANLRLNGKTLTLGSNATLVEGSNGKKVFDYGADGKIVTTRTIGDGGTSDFGGLGLTVTLPSGKSMGSTTIERYTRKNTMLYVPDGQNGLDGLGNQPIERFFRVTPTNNGTVENPLNATVVFNYKTAGFDINNELAFAMYRRASGDSQWEKLNGSLSTNSKTLTVNNFPRFSDVTLGGGGSPLPVELVSFTGACDEGIINLTWQTASEFNSSHFDVEKSRDGENWQVLTTLPSAGTSNELITYQTTDQNATDGNNYFRLRQVDIDGTEKLYNPINVSCSEVTTGYFSSFPNPSGSAFQVIVNNKDLVGACTMNIVDASGKIIETRSIEVKDGINMFVINQELNPGIYFLNVTNGTKSTPVLRHAIK